MIAFVINKISISTDGHLIDGRSKNIAKRSIFEVDIVSG